ncbi:UPF0182 family protein [uncultured Propionibacterium sp.]|uniref:UPF0182 family membrane protein n=1 Tax=uncultured Propionibacterium sp. TaxID=218066 RepID=UPI00292DA840|nr:UPF0182 family protein [uncultured Propionibacterium sp.]
MSTASQARKAPRRHTALGATLIILVALIVVWWIVSDFVTDWMWYRNLHFGRVFSTRLITGAILAVAQGVLLGGACALSMALAWRRRPQRPVSDSPTLDHYRSALARRTAVVIAVPSLIIALAGGSLAVSHVDQTLAFLNRTPFGQSDAYFGMDVSFYVFTLPFLQYVFSVVLAALIIGTIAAAVVHVITGSLYASPVSVHQHGSGEGSRPPTVELKNPLNAAAQVHLSVMLGLIMVVYGFQRLLSRYEFAISDNDALFTGIGYADDHARITARLIIAIIAWICALMFFANVRLRLWRVPGTAIILMIVSSLIIQVAYPAVIQQFTVRPSEVNQERSYIERQIEATRAAYDIDDVTVSDYSAETDVSAGQLRSDAEALPGIRLMDPALIAETYEQLQQVRGYYQFPSVLDVDRYNVDGQTTDTIIAAREINIAGLPDQSWINTHTVYTHGYGVVASYGNRSSTNGEPVWTEGDIPPEGRLDVQESRIYYGESEGQWVVAGNAPGATPVELDTPGGSESGGEQHYTYTGAGGVAIGNYVTRAMYATKFTDLNLLLSSNVNSASRILYNRTPRERIAEVAPWLTVDQDPYPAVVDGRVVWIVDAYTTSADYPNSQHVNLQSTISDSARQSTGADTRVNYMRNSVKAVVDAYDGTVRLYAWDTSDPILQTWMKVYPGLLLDRSEISDDLMSHLRYPQDMFKVQRQILGRYHMENADSWYNQSDLWEVPADPRDSSGAYEPPYYLSIKWPGDESPMFSQTAVYVPKNRENMAAYMSVVADAASPDYGRIRVLKLSDTAQVPGPNQTYNAIVSDQQVADKLLPFIGQGTGSSADALYGNLLTLPLGNGLIYVEPIYTQRKSAGSGASAGTYPVLRFVVVRFGTHIGIGDTLQEALDSVFAGDAGASTGEDTGQQSSGQEQAGSEVSDEDAAKQLLQEADDAFTRADEALKNGDLGEYQTQVETAQAKAQEAYQRLNG